MLRACVAKVPQNVLPETLLPPLGRPQSLPATISAETSKSPFWSPGRLILAAPGDRVLNPPSKHRAGRATRVTRMGYELSPFACPGVLRELACHTLPSTPGPAECAKRLNHNRFWGSEGRFGLQPSHIWEPAPTFNHSSLLYVTLFAWRMLY